MRGPSRSDWAINKQIDRRVKELAPGGQGGMVQHSNEYHDPDMALGTHNHDSAYVNEADHTKTTHDALAIGHTSLTDKGTNTHAQVDTHLGASAPHSGHETPSGAQAKVDAHKDVTTGVHGAGTSTIETIVGSQDKVDTHAAVAAPHSGHVQVAGQIGGTAASPDVRGIRTTTGPTLLTLGAVADGQYLLRSGATLIGGSPGGGSPPAWKGNIAAAWADGEPDRMISHMLHNPVNATPTNITISIARCAFFKLDTALTINKIRFFGVGATTNVFRVAIYQLSNLARLTSELAFTTVAQTWGAAGSALNLALSAGVIYFIAVAVNAIGTTAGCQCYSGTTGRIGILPTAWPGNLDIDAASPKINAIGFCQFAVTTGALPNPANTLALQAAWTGGMPAFFLDNNNA